MQASILNDKLTVIKNMRQKTYLGYSNSVFVFKDRFLAWNVHRYIESEKQRTMTMRDEDAVNKYMVLPMPMALPLAMPVPKAMTLAMADEKTKNNDELQIVTEEKNQMMSTLAAFDMNVVVVDMLKMIAEPDGGLELICSHQATPQNPILRVKQVSLNKLLQMNTVFEWQKQADSLKQIVEDLDGVIDSINKYTNSSQTEQ